MCDDDLKCVCHSDGGLCINSSDFYVEDDATHFPLYVPDASKLISDGKDIFDRTVRMFIQMSAGEVIGFVASSLVAIGACFILGTYFYRCMKQPSCRMPRFWDNSWRVDTLQLANSTEEMERQNNKDKMVASVLYNMRVESATVLSEENSGDITQNHRTFYRSELPPLPDVGRIISIIGSHYVNDSIIPNDVDETLTVDGTANDSRTSGVNDLNSGRGTAPDLGILPRSQPRRRDRLRSRSRLFAEE